MSDPSGHEGTRTPALSKQEYEALVEQAPILIWRARPDTLCDYFNRRWLEFRGRTLEQEFGNGWAEGVHPDDLDRCVAHYLENFHAHRPFEMEYRLLRHDGAYRWIFDRGVPFFADDGAFAGYIGSCIDVTERVEALGELAVSNAAALRALERLVPMCTWCKKIRDAAGAWKGFDVFVLEQAQGTVTHGICPDCTREHFGLEPE